MQQQTVKHFDREIVDILLINIMYRVILSAKMHLRVMLLHLLKKDTRTSFATPTIASENFRIFLHTR